MADITSQFYYLLLFFFLAKCKYREHCFLLEYELLLQHRNLYKPCKYSYNHLKHNKKKSKLIDWVNALVEH